jgi:thioredoxin-related protein
MKYIISLVILAFSIPAFAQDSVKLKLYSPQENATAIIEQKIKEAKKQGKHVLLQVGGNWCGWCIRFHNFVTYEPSLDSLLRNNYIVYNLNYSPENYNVELLKKYQYPQRFGFPVFLVLNGEGKLLHTQNSAYLEEGKGYNKDKVAEFFNHWSPQALDPKQYKEQ